MKEQAEILKERGITVGDEWFLVNVLSSFSFKSILNTCDRMRPLFESDITLELLYSLHIDLHDLKQLFLKYILLVENSLKFKMSYVISDNYGTETDFSNLLNHDKCDYLSVKYYTGDRQSVIIKLKKNIRASRNSSLEYYRDQRGNIPAWILLENTYFHLAINWYRTLKEPLKSLVCNSMFLRYNSGTDNVQRKEFLNKALMILKDYRNSYAHSNRIDMVKDELPHTPTSLLFDASFYNKADFNNGIGKNDLTALISILCILAPDEYIAFRLESDLHAFMDKYQDNDVLPENVSIFDILNLPHDILDRVSNFTRKL